MNQLFTISRTTIPFNNTDQPIELLINEINPNLMLYTRVSAGLALGLGALSFFLAISIFIRVCKCEAGTAIKCIFTIVSINDKYDSCMHVYIIIIITR